MLRGMDNGNRLFWSIVIFVGVMFLWLKFLDSIIHIKFYPIFGVIIIFVFLFLTRKPDDYEEIKFE